jgi:hypothetical protein
MKVRFEVKIVLGLVFASMVAAAASADTVWSYQGNVINYVGGIDFGPGGAPPGAAWDQGVNPCNCALDGTVVLNDSGKAIAWSFTIGSHTLTNLNSSAAFFPFNCFGCGAGNVPSSLDSVPFGPAAWAFTITGQGIELDSKWRGSLLDARDEGFTLGSNSFFLDVESDPGTWTETVAAAEPATGLFVGLGLAVFGLMRRRRKKPLENAVWEKLG